jgi:hypothetical protein
LGEAHNLEQKAPLSAIGSTIDQLTYVKEIVTSIPTTLVLTEIPPDIPKDKLNIRSINLNLFLQDIGLLKNITFSDIRRQVFATEKSPNLYLEIISRSRNFSDLDGDEWQLIYGKINRFITSREETLKVLFPNITNNLRRKLEDLQKQRETFIEKYDDLYGKVLSTTEKDEYDTLSHNISLKQPFVGIYPLIYYARKNLINEGEINSLWELFVQINNSNQIFIQIQQDVLDINMLFDMYQNNQYNNFVFVVGDAHRRNLKKYFKDAKWDEIKDIDGSFGNTINLKGTYTPQTLEGCIKQLEEEALERQRKRSKY